MVFQRVYQSLPLLRAALLLTRPAPHLLEAALDCVLLDHEHLLVERPVSVVDVVEHFVKTHPPECYLQSRRAFVRAVVAVLADREPAEPEVVAVPRALPEADLKRLGRLARRTRFQRCAESGR